MKSWMGAGTVALNIQQNSFLTASRKCLSITLVNHPTQYIPASRQILTSPIVLARSKSDVTEAQLADFTSSVQSLVGQIPGLQTLKAGYPYPSTASRTHGFNVAVIALLERSEDLQVYTDHPAHTRYVEVDMFHMPASRSMTLMFHDRLQDRLVHLFEDMLAYDLEFSEW